MHLLQSVGVVRANETNPDYKLDCYRCKSKWTHSICKENWECREFVTYYSQCPCDSWGIYCCNGSNGCQKWFKHHLKRKQLNSTDMRMIDRKVWVYETKEAWQASIDATKEFVAECIAFEKEAQRKRVAQAVARKRRREEMEEAAFQWECEQKYGKKAKSEEVVQSAKAEKPAGVVKPAVTVTEAGKPVEAAKVPTIDKAVKVESTVQVSPAPDAGAPFVSSQSSDGMKVVSGLAELVAKMRLYVKTLSMQFPGLTPQIARGAAGGLNRMLENMDLVIVALRTHVH